MEATAEVLRPAAVAVEAATAAAGCRARAAEKRAAEANMFGNKKMSRELGQAERLWMRGERHYWEDESQLYRCDDGVGRC